MATLYTHRAENIRRTWLLIGAFVSLIAVVGWAFSYWLDEPAAFPIAVGIAVAMSLVSYWFSDKIVISVAGAKPLEKSADPELYRLVENLAITAGLPMPRLYVVDDAAPNAFATGRNPKHAVIAVTTGLRQRLEKPELEGVLAHELSHIGNRDMKVAAIAAVLAGTIATLANLLLRMSFHGGFSRGRDRRDAGGVLVIIGLLVAIILAPIASTLLRLAISRRREFLADATGALLTRYPEGLARALEKIAVTPIPMRHASDSIAHLWLSDPKPKVRGASWLTTLFQTHPPIEERIRILREMSL